MGLHYNFIYVFLRFVTHMCEFALLMVIKWGDWNEMFDINRIMLL